MHAYACPFIFRMCNKNKNKKKMFFFTANLIRMGRVVGEADRGNAITIQMPGNALHCSSLQFSIVLVLTFRV